MDMDQQLSVKAAKDCYRNSRIKVVRNMEFSYLESQGS